MVGAATFIAAQALLARGEEMKGTLVRGIDPALDALKQSLEGLETQQQVQPETGLPLLMIRAEPTPQG